MNGPASVRLSLCPVDRDQQRRPAGLLLSALTGRACLCVRGRWLQRKDDEWRQHQETQRHLATVHALTARNSKKSLALAQALSHAHALRYTSDIYGHQY